MKSLSNEQENPDSIPNQNQTEMSNENNNNNNEALIVSNASSSINNRIKNTKQPKIPAKNNSLFNAADILQELTQNKELINIGNQGDDSGSDSNPSEDDIPQSEIKKFLPIKLKSSKKPKKKVKKKNEKTISTSDIPPKKPEKSQPEQRGQTPNALVKEIKVEISSALPIIKEEKIKPNSEKFANFRIKNIKRSFQNKDIVNIVNLGEPPLTKEIVMIDNETQTEEIYFAEKEDFFANKTKEPRNLSIITNQSKYS